MDRAPGSRPTQNPPRRRCALVTRPRAEAEELAAALTARGIASLIEPLIEIAFSDAPPPDLAGVQAILCTSANGVRALARLSGERRVPLFAVGASSAAAADAAGFVRVESANGNAGDLARLVGERLSPDAGTLLHVAGRDVAGDLAGDLGVRGFAVERAVIYEARPAVALSDAAQDALAGGAIDFALFFSPRTAAIFARLIAAASLAAAMRGVTAVSISTAADAALDPLRWRARVVAEQPNQAAMLAILDHLHVARCGA
jgi:uroporphyrinogen-III synthase